MLGEPSATHTAADGTLPAAAVWTRAGTLRARIAGHTGDESERARARDEGVRLDLTCGNQLMADLEKAMGQLDMRQRHESRGLGAVSRTAPKGVDGTPAAPDPTRHWELRAGAEGTRSTAAGGREFSSALSMCRGHPRVDLENPRELESTTAARTPDHWPA